MISPKVFFNLLQTGQAGIRVINNIESSPNVLSSALFCNRKIVKRVVYGTKIFCLFVLAFYALVICVVILVGNFMKLIESKIRSDFDAT